MRPLPPFSKTRRIRSTFCSRSSIRRSAGGATRVGGAGSATRVGGAGGATAVGGASGASAVGGASGASAVGGAGGALAVGGASGASAVGGESGASAVGGAQRRDGCRRRRRRDGCRQRRQIGLHTASAGEQCLLPVDHNERALTQVGDGLLPFAVGLRLTGISHQLFQAARQTRRVL